MIGGFVNRFADGASSGCLPETNTIVVDLKGYVALDKRMGPTFTGP
jgi:hypothetical protein